MHTRIASVVITLIIIGETIAQIEFPEHYETDKKKANLAGRLPLYAPTRCKHDELLYPGDQIDDWVCDCAPAALYHPETDACYPAFRRGPCEPEQFLVLAPTAILPECIPNVCKTDGHIKINNICYEFGSSIPCRNAQLSYVLGVDPETMMVDCVRLSLSVGTRIDVTTPATPTYDMAKVNQCARGTKRAENGQCVTQQQREIKT